ncbi:acetolactate synthase catalytic subunit [Pararhodobacter oceanensis]|uniref:acetolactate synthase catalytic subunit n=1 Tax=Pararhodobacter oceanensis TaxID=2172121 RepID=UPI003A8D1601
MLIAENVTTPPHALITGNDASGAARLAQALARHGVDTAFGQSIPSLFHLVAPRFGIKQAAYRTENAGGAMADSYARASNKIALVTAQNGPAATLLVAPLAEALKASVPVIALVQEVAAADADRNAFQEMDHAALFSGVAKWVRRISDPARIEDYVDMAVVTASSGRPGPVVLLVPPEVLAAREVKASPRRAQMGRFPLDRPAPDHEAVQAAAELLRHAERPLVIAGGGVHLSQAQDALTELQERAHLPVATTLMGKGAVAETHVLSLGIVGHVMGEGARAEHLVDYLRSADVVLLVGNKTNQNGTNSWRLYPREARYIHLDIDGAEIGRNYEALRLMGDARSGLQALTRALTGGDLAQRAVSRSGIEAQIAEARGRFDAHLQAVAARSDAPAIRPERVMQELDARLTAQAIVVSDASYSSVWTGNYLTAQRVGMRFISPRGLAGLGWGLPMAIGAKLARPEAPVICVTGDGGFGHCWAEVETAVRLRLSLVILVLNNQILGYQKDAEDVIFGAHTEACDFAPVNHAAIARACGARGVRVDDAELIGAALDEALAHEGVTVLDVVSDPAARPPISFYRGKFTDS